MKALNVTVTITILAIEYLLLCLTLIYKLCLYTNQPHPRPELIDARVVDGHVIPNLVLFTRATPDDHPYETLAFSDNLKVTISFSKTEEGNCEFAFL